VAKGSAHTNPAVGASPRVLANVGCGPRGSSLLPAYFQGWQELRIDVDPRVEPDIVGTLTDLSAIADGSVDALWAAHCLEHLYEHQVPQALSEFCRVIKDDGFVCIIVPDLQAIANYVASDRMHEPAYQSPAGPITPHDMIYGHGAAIANGRTSMAHRCGFTPGMMSQHLRRSPFCEVAIRRRSTTLELAVLGRKTVTGTVADRDLLIEALGL
jgi:predicted SAM-dependent methyltransferase